MKERKGKSEEISRDSQEARVAGSYPEIIANDRLARVLFDEGARCLARIAKDEDDASMRSFLGVRAGLAGQMLAKVYPILEVQREHESPVDKWFDLMKREDVT